MTASHTPEQVWHALSILLPAAVSEVAAHRKVPVGEIYALLGESEPGTIRAIAGKLKPKLAQTVHQALAHDSEGGTHD